MQDLWPYPVAQAMQRQTGCRIKRQILAGPPLAPEPAEAPPAAAGALQPVLPAATDDPTPAAPRAEG
jgi:hypothetical protein